MKLRNWLLALALIGVAVIALANAGQLETFVQLIKGLRWYIIAAVVVVQIYSYYTNAKFYQSFLAIFGYKLDARRLFEASLAVNFVNQILPAGGLAGATFLTQVTKPEVPRAQGILAQIIRQSFSLLAVVVLLPVGFLMLFLGNDIDRVTVKIIALLMLIILIISIFLVAMVDHERFCRNLFERIRVGLNHFATRVLRRKHQLISAASAKRFADDFYEGYHMLKSDWRQMTVPMIWSIAYIVVEMLTLYLVFLAFNADVNPGVVVAAYTMANIASVVGGLIASIGVYEATMVATLVALGSSFTLAFSVTLVYRTLNMIIGLPPGLYYYRKHLP